MDERKKKEIEESVEENITNDEQDVELQVSEDSADGQLKLIISEIVRFDYMISHMPVKMTVIFKQ